MTQFPEYYLKDSKLSIQYYSYKPKVLIFPVVECFLGRNIPKLGLFGSLSHWPMEQRSDVMVGRAWAGEN